jgi:hypothetical protein
MFHNTEILKRQSFSTLKMITSTLTKDSRSNKSEMLNTVLKIKKNVTRLIILR